MKAALSNWKHPLRDRLFEWAEADRGLVEYGPPEQIWENYSRAMMIEPRLGEEVAKREFEKTYQRTMWLAITLDGHLDDSFLLHELCFKAVHGNTLAFALADAAFYARNHGARNFGEFVKAMRLDGFEEALAVWTNHFEYGKAFDQNIKIGKLYSDVLTGKGPDAKFYGKMAIDLFPDMDEFFLKFDKVRKDANESKRVKADRRRSGSKERQPPKYRNFVAGGWIPLSFWARSVRSIVYILDKYADDPDGAAGRIGRDISELYFTATHKSEYESQIEKSAKEKRKKS